MSQASPARKRELATMRRLSEPAVLAGQAVCRFCGNVIVPGKVQLRPTQRNPLGRLVSNWDWDHKTRAPAHLGCNRSDGAKVGNANRGARRGRRRPRVFGAVSASRTW